MHAILGLGNAASLTASTPGQASEFGVGLCTIAARGELTDVTAGDESLATRARIHHRAHVIVGGKQIERFADTIPHLDVDRIALRGLVEQHHADIVDASCHELALGIAADDLHCIFQFHFRIHQRLNRLRWQAESYSSIVILAAWPCKGPVGLSCQTKSMTHSSQ